MTRFFLNRIYLNLLNGGEDICCKINEDSLSYGMFSRRVGSIQNCISGLQEPAVGITTDNHPDTYAAIIACWLSGKAFVPINPEYPKERLHTICEEAGLHTILHAGQREISSVIREKLPDSRLIHTDDATPSAICFSEVPVENTAYMLFTSGTTGKPKGVPISFANLQAFTEGFETYGYELSPADRFLQMFELTFDLSVMCYTVPLMIGASFYTLPSGMIKTFGLYHVLESEKITFSLMVPSAIQLLAPYLEDIVLPELRYSQFCGEALKTDLLHKWLKCVPGAMVENVYGPTEATIYCTRQPVPRQNPDAVSTSGIVNIGKDMLWVKTALFEGEQKIVQTGIHGELCISGKQVTAGYLNNPEQNSRSFFEKDGTRFYRTGDLAAYGDSGDLIYLGRLDDQVKIQGYRIELAEIELAVKKLIPTKENVVVAVEQEGGIWKLAVFLQGTGANESEILDRLRDELPEYMMPHLVYDIPEFPLNANGKTDRKKLREIVLNSHN